MNVDYLRPSGEQRADKVERPASIALESLLLDPFANTRDSRFYFASSLHQSAVDQLKDMLDTEIRAGVV